MPSQIVRILCEARSQSRTIRDSVTGERPFLWRGSSIIFQLGLTDNGQHLLRAVVGTIIVEVKRLDATSADDSLMRKEFVAADCDATFTAADWTGGAKQLLAASFTVEESALYPGVYRLIVRHEGSDGTALTHLSAEFAVLDPQSGSEGIDAPPVAWTYLDALPVVRADIAQSLSDPQKAQARANIGAGETTTAAIVTALSTATLKQEADIRDSLEVLPRDLHLRGLRNTINLASSTGDCPVSILPLGDSFSDFAVFNRSARIVGAYQCGAAAAGGDSGVTTVSNDFAKSPSGVYQSIASGGNLTCAHLQSGNQGPANQVYYTFFPGTGTAQLQYSNNGGAWTNVTGGLIDTTAITDVQIGTLSLPSAWQNVRCRVTATGGTVNGWIGQGLSGPGITLAPTSAASGTGVQQSATVSEAVWKAMVAGYKASGGAQIVFVTFADARYAEGASGPWAKGAALWAQNGPIDTLYQWSKVSNPTVDWMICGPHQVDPARNEGADATLDPLYSALGIGSSTNERIKDGARAQRDWSILRSEGFVDSIPLFPDYTAAFADGVYDDQVHLSAKGEAFKRAWVWRSSNMGFVLGDAGYNSAIRLGGGNLVMLAPRAAGTLPQVSAYSTGLVPVMLSATFSECRSGDPANPEQSGVTFRSISANLGRISTYGTSSYGDLIEFTLSGGTPQWQPVTTTTVGSASNCNFGWTGRRFGDVVTAGLNVGYRTVTTTTTVANTDHTIFANAAGGAFSINLPAAGPNAGRLLAVVKVDSSGNAATLDGNASETINGATTLALTTQWERAMIQSDGSNWVRVA